MVWMRDRSGRSGRRRGSQKPGTTTLRDGATPSPAATAGRAPVATDKSTQKTQAISQSARRGGSGRPDPAIANRIDRHSVLRSPALAGSSEKVEAKPA